MAPKSIGDFPYVVEFKTASARRFARWRPPTWAKSQTMDFTMTPVFQRGGMAGDFQTLGTNPRNFKAFIPFHTLVIVLTAEGFERLHGDNSDPTDVEE